MLFVYPDWKKALVEARRVFVGAVLAEIGILMTVPEVRESLLADTATVWKCLLPYDHICFLGASIWADAWILLILPAITAGYKGLVKYVQEKLGQGDYSHWSYRL